MTVEAGHTEAAKPLRKAHAAAMDAWPASTHGGPAVL